jgi:hypothetical protein
MENLHEDHPVFGHHAPLNKDKMLGQADLSCFKRKFFLNAAGVSRQMCLFRMVCLHLLK